jgi:hypothetical protein
MTDPFSDAAADLLTSVGRSAVYRPKTGSQVDTTVFVSTEVGATGDEMRVAETAYSVLCRVDEVGIPIRGDQFDIDGTTYTVDDLADEAGDAYLVRVIVR